MGDDQARLWELLAEIVEQLTAEPMKPAEPTSGLRAGREGVPFCGFRFMFGDSSKPLEVVE